MFTFQDELDNNNMVRESLHVFHRSEKSRVLSKKKSCLHCSKGKTVFCSLSLGKKHHQQ